LTPLHGEEDRSAPSPSFQMFTDVSSHSYVDQAALLGVIRFADAVRAEAAGGCSYPAPPGDPDDAGDA
jgi:hypothetical protein